MFQNIIMNQLADIISFLSRKNICHAEFSELFLGVIKSVGFVIYSVLKAFCLASSIVILAVTDWRLAVSVSNLADKSSYFAL